jgi:endonuclease YncB( thermonuclease family)
MVALKTAIVLVSFYMVSQMSFKTIKGVVIGVPSGDTITVTVDGTDYKVRVADVDCPDNKQAFYRQASEFTSKLAMGKKVHVNYETIDRVHKYVVGDVILPDGRNLGKELISEGMAWYYRVKPAINEIYAQREYSAWSRKVGLWVDPNPVPPWEFRREDPLPDPPDKPEEVDYDQIFNYGLIGNKKMRTYEWPACKDYNKMNPNDRVILTNKQTASILGYKMAKSCVGH